MRIMEPDNVTMRPKIVKWIGVVITAGGIITTLWSPHLTPVNQNFDTLNLITSVAMIPIGLVFLWSGYKAERKSKPLSNDPKR